MEKSVIKQVLITQKNEFMGDSEPLIHRDTISFLSAQLESKLVKVIQGVRRCGKSSLCKSVLLGRRTAYVNFDDERFIDAESKDLQKVLEVLEEIYPKFEILFFDEIQNISGWELFINRLQRNKYNIVLTGSNGKLLGKDLATHLTGRQISTMLYPFSYPEYKKLKLPFDTHKTEYEKFENYFKLGGFPEVLKGEERDIYLQELFDKIISRDIVQRFKVREAKLLKELAIYLIQNSSQKSSFQNLVNQFNFKSLTTVRKYLGYLMDVFLVAELRGYSYKLTERSTSRPKIYSCDVGLMNALWTKPTQDLGAKLETLVFNSLVKRKNEIYYFANQQHEVDFGIVFDRKIKQLIQVCYSLTNEKTYERETKALLFFSKKYDCDDLLILTANEKYEKKIGSKSIKIQPVFEWLEG
jgi:predicted AAA+ superfamily ATPase